MSVTLWKRLFIFLAFVGSLGMGVLLYGLYSGVEGLRHRDESRVRTVQIVEELRNSTRQLTSLARTRVSTGSTEAERQYHRELASRDGVGVRSRGSLVSPGVTLSLLDMLEKLPLTSVERESLHEALEISRLLSITEVKAMSMVTGVDVRNLTTPENRGIAREALDLLFNHDYQQLVIDIQRLLDTQAQGILGRMGAEEDKTLHNMALQAMGLCICLVLTGASLLIIGYLGHGGAVARGRAFRRYLYILLMLMASLAVPIWLVYMDARQIMVGTLEKRQALICREVYRELNLRADRAMELARVMGTLSHVRAYVQRENTGQSLVPELRTNALEVLGDIAKGYTDIAHALLLGADGKVLLSTIVGSPLRKQSVLPEVALKKVQQGQSFVTVMRDPTSQLFELVVVAPVPQEAGSDQVMGAVVVALDRRNSFQLWEDRLAVEERMNIFIIDESGAVVLSSRGLSGQGLSHFGEAVGKLSLTDTLGLQYFTDIQGQERVAYFMPIPELGWTIGVSSIFASTTVKVNEMLVRATVFGTVSVLLTIAFFSLLVQGMTRNLRVANERMTALVEGMGMYSWEYNTITNLYSFNHQWHTLMELPGPAQAGQWALDKLHAAVHPEDIDTLLACLSAAKLGEYIQFEVRHVNYNGHVRHCIVLGYVEKEGPQGKVFSGVARDVTSAKLLELSEEKLRMSNERMTQLMGGAGIHTWEINDRTEIFTYDAQWFRSMRGAEPAEDGAVPLVESLGRIHPDFAALVANLRGPMPLGHYVKFDLRILGYNEEYIWHRSIAKVVELDDAGNAVCYSGMGYDITAEKSLEESEELLRRQSASLTDAHERMGNLMQAVGMYMWEFDMERGTIGYDAQWHRLMELPGTPVSGVWTLEYLFSTAHPDDVECTFKAMAQTVEGDFLNFDVRHKTHTEQWIWVRIMARVDKCNAEGRVMRMSGMGYEITALKVVEQSEASLKMLTAELHGAKERMEGIIEAASMFTYEMDIAAGVVRHNAQWARFWGVPGEPQAGEMPLAFLRENIHPESQEEFIRILYEKSGNSFSVDLQVCIYGGDWRWCRQLGRVEEYDAEGRPLRVVGTGFDITAMKMMELSEAEYKQQLEELVAYRTAELEESRNQAQAASQAKTIFLSTVSHEIRTPMNAIVGFSHIFDRSNLSQSQKDHLDKIRLSAETLLGVINDVLDISKIEAGKLELERVGFSLHNMLDTVCSIVEFAANSKGLTLHIHVADNVPARLMGDPKRISQILLNLMNNAVKFTMYGTVSLDVSLEEGEDKPERVSLAFSVTDTGIGLNEEQMGRLFLPFTQADSSVTRKYGGTGLGLAISKQLVELMGGDIGVTSQFGEGSTFRFTLRLDVASEAEAQAGMESGLPSDPEVREKLKAVEGLHVLVAEDNEINQEIARALLEEHGLVVDMAANGRQALTMAAMEQYSCIFMDMQMPVMGGLEAVTAMRHKGQEAEAAGSEDKNLRWLARVPIIAMTANAMTEDKQRCLECGMDDHIGKPIDPFLLQRCLLRWLVRK